MATFFFLVHLLLIGTLIIPTYTKSCELTQNATASNFSINVRPEDYKANTTYTVGINGNRNFTDSKNVSQYLLQALSPANQSVGQWEVTEKENCSSIVTAILSANQTAANWTSPVSNISSVEIRAYIIFGDEHVELSSVTLNKETTTTAPLLPTPNSVSLLQASSCFIAAIQGLLLLATSKLLS
ncbi:placenta-expressed transcript 1 protein-like [Heliangelus exortis]|uniref:placenta-expressed transcript 1 protein-like n=1 Tax=Heliangelus exortis TaxID=472823 RepID=UPI003A8D9DE0